MAYLYETHLHTSQGSLCGRSEGKEYPALYKALGYDGIFITDHFFQGNCAAPREGRWEDRIDAYMRGYEDAREEGAKCGLKVFFGIEQCFPDHDEYLLYGIDRAFLLMNPDIERVTHEELFARVHAYGGCVIQAHPFRDRGYVDRLHFQLSGIDGVEAINSGNQPHEDVCALKYAGALGFRVTSGSDIHGAETVTPARLCGVYLDVPLSCERDYTRYLLSGRPVSLHCPQGRLEGVDPRMPVKPWHAYSDEAVVTDFDLKGILS